MKIAITGHSKGIGKGLYDFFSKDHDVLGFSRSNGFDISKDKDIIIEQSKDCDIFVNNAQHENHQLHLFNALYKIWQKEYKTIVNIGSIVKYKEFYESKSNDDYTRAKINLGRSSINKVLSRNKVCRIISVNPGLVYTDLTSNIKGMNMLTVEELTPIIAYTILLPQYIEVGEVGIWRTF